MKKLLFFLATALISMAVSSCNKDSSSSNPFVGTWTIYSGVCGSIYAPVGSGSFVVITAGSGSTLNLTEYAGESGCTNLKAITMQGTIDSNTFYCPTQTITDNCGNSFTLYIEGEIDGQDLILNEGTSVSYCTVYCTK